MGPRCRVCGRHSHHRFLQPSLPVVLLPNRSTQTVNSGVVLVGNTGLDFELNSVAKEGRPLFAGNPFLFRLFHSGFLAI